MRCKKQEHRVVLPRREEAMSFHFYASVCVEREDVQLSGVYEVRRCGWDYSCNSVHSKNRRVRVQ